MKVLYHIDSESKWHMVLENVKNMLKYGKENNVTFEIEVVANGIAVLGLQELVAQKSKWYLEMDELIREKVVFAACNNALNKFGLTPEQLCAFAQVVPAGVVEIVKKQEEGYSYIKP
jgi:intracellular sulfur oxidation DsrE/DsrF family protein